LVRDETSLPFKALEVKVLFIQKRVAAPSSRIRVTDLFPVLKALGIDPIAHSLPKSRLNRRKFLKSAREFDVVVIQKKMMSSLDFGLLRKNAKKLVFDFDDAVYCKDAACSTDVDDYHSTKKLKRFRRIIKKSDLIVAANNELASVAKRENGDQKGVLVIPSPVETGEVQTKDDYRISSPPVVGWIGSDENFRYLEFILPAFYQVYKKMRFELRVIANGVPKLPGIDIRFIPWNLKTQYSELRAFDVGIMPLSDDPFSRGKSAYKVLQYMASGIPSLCSSIGMNKELADGEQYCLGSNSFEEFAHQLLRLLENRELREKLGRNGRKLVEENYSVKVIGENLARTLLELNNR
jgi:glycosyltransferase involved in cell wall biosynthesis